MAYFFIRSGAHEITAVTAPKRNTDRTAAPPGSIVGTLRALARGKLEFLIAGGVAANLYGSTRMTMDLDLIPSLKTKDWQRMLAQLETDGFVAVDATPEDLRNPTRLRRWARARGAIALRLRRETPPLTIDLLFQAGEHYEYYKGRCRTEGDGNELLRVVSPEDLIEMKRAAGRPHDFLDIAAIEAAKKKAR